MTIHMQIPFQTLCDLVGGKSCFITISYKVHCSKLKTKVILMLCPSAE